MASILQSLMSLFLIALIFSLIPRPTTSSPFVALERTRNRSSLTSSSFIMGGPQIFGIAFAFASFLALLCTWAWITNRMTFFIRLINRTICLLAAPTNIAQQLSHVAGQVSYIAQQFSYLRFATILRVATATVLDADDARPPLTPRRGGLANPVSPAPQSRSQWARFRGGQGM